jgi:uncharacterized protein involved in outer membrane biogenesis
LRLKSLAVAAAVLLTAALAAIAAAVYFLDPTSLAMSLAASVKADTGRDLSLGAVGITFLPRPALDLQEVRFGNAAWGSRPWIVQAGRASADIDVLALFSRRLRIKHIEVTDASVFLETDRGGKGNWVIDLPGSRTPPWLESLQINELKLESLAFAYRDGASGKTTAAQVDAARIDAPGDARPIHFSARGTFAGKKVEVAGTAGALTAMLADAPAYPVDLEGKVGAASFGLRGSIDKPRTLGGLEMALSVRTAELGELAGLLGGSARPLGPFSGAAQLTGSAAAPGFSDIDATLGGGERPEIRLRGAVADLRAASGVDLKLTASAAKPWRFGKAASGPRLPPFRASARLRDAQPGYRVDELDLRIADGTANASQQVVQGGQLAIKDGRLNVNALQATLGGARVTLDGSIADPRNLAGLDLGIALQGDDLAELFKFFGGSIRPIGPYAGRGRIQGSLDALRLTAIDAQAGRSGQSVHVSGQIAEAPDGYAFEDLKLALGRTSMQGRVAFARGEARPHFTADLSGRLVDLSELPRPEPIPGGTNPLLAADVEANIRFDRVVLPDRRELGPVSGGVVLTAGAVGLKQFSVAVEGASATLEGRIGDPLKLAALDLTVNIQVARPAGLEAFTEQHLPLIPAFTASGRLTDVSDGYSLAGLKVAHAATTITGDLTVTRGAKRFKISAKASSPLLDVTKLTQPSDKGSTAKPKGGTRAIPDVPLPLNILRLVDADLDLRFDSVKVGEAAPLGPLTAHAVIADGSLKAEPVQLVVKADQLLSALVAVDAAQNGWALRIQGKGIDFGELLARLGKAGVVTGGSTDLGIQLQGRGNSLRALLGSLDGAVRVGVGPHRIHNFAVNLEGGLVLHMFALANPFQKSDPDTDVKCFAVLVPVRNGIFTSERNIAIETAKYNVVASGTVNLHTERIDMTVTPVVRNEAGTIVRVGGTLVAPSFGLDAAGAARSAASLGAAVVAPAWLIADSLIKKTVSDPNPCITAFRKGE